MTLDTLWRIAVAGTAIVFVGFLLLTRHPVAKLVADCTTTTNHAPMRGCP